MPVIIFKVPDFFRIARAFEFLVSISRVFIFIFRRIKAVSMAVARGVQGGRGHLPPPQPPGRWKKIDKDYSNWIRIKKN